MSWEITARIEDKDGALQSEGGELSLMDESLFSSFYSRTARPLWAYLYHMTGDAGLAEDLLQDAYCKFLAAAGRPEEFGHQRNYLYRVATNLVRDHFRKGRHWREVPDAELPEAAASVADVELQTDIRRILGKMRLRERQLLWMAYVEGATHREIASILGMREVSVRPLLFYARRKMARLLERRGIGALS